MHTKTIAVAIQNLIQFYSIKSGIDALISKGYLVDIFVPTGKDNSGFGNLFDETYSKLLELGYTPKRNVDLSVHYKILLEPYPLDNYLNFNYTYRLKFKYSLLSAKPNLVYTPDQNIYYDAILCYSKYDSEFLKVYSHTELIGNLKFINFSKIKTNSPKPVLLYLPTYGDSSSIEFLNTNLEQIKSKYYLIIKAHHGTSKLNSEISRIDILKNLADEYYDQTTPLVDLLAKANVVLSDNSGAIFEALYANTPVAICASDINKNKLNNFNTIQYKLVKDDIIPYSPTPDKILDILNLALSEKCINKQKSISEELFYRPNNPIDVFVSVIEKYLNDNINIEYKNIHDILVRDYIDKNNSIVDLNNKLTLINNAQENCNLKLKELQNKYDETVQILNSKNIALKYYENGKLYKLCKKIYKLKNKE